MAATKAGAKKAPAKKAPAKKAAAAKKAPAKKASAKKAAAKRSPAKKAAAKKPAAKKTAAKKTAAKKTAARKAPAKKAAAKRSPAKKATTKKTAARKAPAKKAPAKKAPAKKAPAAKATAPRSQGRSAGKRTWANQLPVPKKVRARPKGPLDKFLLAQLAALEEERATYIRQAASLKAEADLLAAEREPGDVQFDEESGEGDTLAVERERDLALSAQATAAVYEIDLAVAKVHEGTYGVCEQCGSSIPKERLRALPYASLCVQCKSAGFARR
jgi:RNA polymerase-binding transcription factor DksA